MVVNSLLVKWFMIALLFIHCESNTLQVNDETQAGKINKIISDIHSGSYGETHSLLIVKNGEVLAEEYFKPFDSDSIHYLYSVTKSITSLLVGIAIDKGFIQSVDQKLLDFFPQYTDIQNLDERKRAITVRDVLMMRTGMVWDEWSYPYGDPRNDTYHLFGSSDMIKHMLDLPMNASPGTRFTYNSGATMLLSGILESTTGRSTEDFAKDVLFNPLGIEDWQWDTGLYDDLTNTGWGLHLLPKDLVKIGSLFLEDGQSQNIVSESWLNESTQNYGNRYGYQWWHYGPGSTISARGWGGQFIFINEERNVVIVTTGGNFQNSNNYGQRIADQLMKVL